MCAFFGCLAGVLQRPDHTRAQRHFVFAEAFLVAKVDLGLLRGVCGQAVADPCGVAISKPLFVVLAIGVQPRAGDRRSEVGARAERRAAARVDTVDQLWLPLGALSVHTPFLVRRSV